MEKTKTYYTEDLIKEAIEDLQEEIKKDYTENYDDLISEIADNNLPIYTYDLLQYASNNFDLILPNELVNDEPDVTAIIQANIYEVLTEALYQYITKPNKE
tara:strand:+ start:165 stop:467 length:303 start_codon:yes stop_codon:yes gene_type:complete